MNLSDPSSPPHDPREAQRGAVENVAFAAGAEEHPVGNARTRVDPVDEFTAQVKWFADGNRLDGDIWEYIRGRTDQAVAYEQLLGFFRDCLAPSGEQG